MFPQRLINGDIGDRLPQLFIDPLLIEGVEDVKASRGVEQLGDPSHATVATVLWSLIGHPRVLIAGEKGGLAVPVRRAAFLGRGAALRRVPVFLFSALLTSNKLGCLETRPFQVPIINHSIA